MTTGRPVSFRWTYPHCQLHFIRVALWWEEGNLLFRQEPCPKRVYRDDLKKYTLVSWLTFCYINNVEVTSYSVWCSFPLVQGLFIFLIHVLRNSDVRAAYLRKRQKWKGSRSISTSRVSSKGVGVSSNTLANEDVQELTSRRNESPRSSGAGYANTSIVEHDRSMTPVQM